MIKTAARTFQLNFLRNSSYINYRFAQSHTPFNRKVDKKIDTLSTDEHVSKNVGLQAFLQKVYNTTGLSILGALGTSYGVLALPITAAGMAFLAKFGFVASLVGIVGSAFMKPTIYTQTGFLKNRQKVEYLTSRNSLLRKLLYGVGVVGLGLSTAPLIGIANAISPAILPTTLGITAALFGGASLGALRMKNGAMLSYGSILGGSLLGLIGLQLVGLGSLYFVGMNPFATMLLNTSTYFSIGLFTAFIAYDTHLAVRMYEEKLPDHLGMAANFLLDFWNILVSLIKIFARE